MIINTITQATPEHILEHRVTRIRNLKLQHNDQHVAKHQATLVTTISVSFAVKVRLQICTICYPLALFSGTSSRPLPPRSVSRIYN